MILGLLHSWLVHTEWHRIQQTHLLLELNRLSSQIPHELQRKEQRKEENVGGTMESSNQYYVSSAGNLLGQLALLLIVI